MSELNSIAKRSLVVVLAAASGLAGCSYHAIRDDASGTIVWSSDEAYVFIGVDPRGFHASWFRYPWAILKQGLGGVDPPDDDRGFMTVVHVTANGVEDHTIQLRDRRPGSGPNVITPLEGQIYAAYTAGGGLCRWDRDRFVPATPEEQKQVNGIFRLTTLNIDHDKFGWSKRTFGGYDGPLPIQVGNQFKLSVLYVSPRNSGNGLIEIDRQQPGGALQKVWSLDLRQGIVSADEYRRTFQN